MSLQRIAVVVGSNRKESINRKLAQALIKLAPASLRCEMMRIDDLPMFNQDHEQNPAEAVVRIKRHIATSAGVLFVTAEHNRSIPAVLKNALDWGGRPYGHNSWAGKPAALIGASIGTIGTAIVQQHLRSVLGYLDMPTLGQPEAYIHFTDDLIDGDGNIAPEHIAKFLKIFIDRYATWVQRLAGG
jgi:chromate reductase